MDNSFKMKKGVVLPSVEEHLKNKKEKFEKKLQKEEERSNGFTIAEDPMRQFCEDIRDCFEYNFESVASFWDAREKILDEYKKNESNRNHDVLEKHKTLTSLLFPFYLYDRYRGGYNESPQLKAPGDWAGLGQVYKASEIRANQETMSTFCGGYFSKDRFDLTPPHSNYVDKFTNLIPGFSNPNEALFTRFESGSNRELTIQMLNNCAGKFAVIGPNVTLVEATSETSYVYIGVDSGGKMIVPGMNIKPVLNDGAIVENPYMCNEYFVRGKVRIGEDEFDSKGEIVSLRYDPRNESGISDSEDWDLNKRIVLMELEGTEASIYSCFNWGDK